MGKVFIAKIEFEYEVDKNNYLEWEDEYESDDVEPRSLADLVSMLKFEFDTTLSLIETKDVIAIEEKGK